MARAITEKGLWERLSANITPPLSIEESVQNHAKYYEKKY
jgi:hypothetical protein